MLLSMIDMKQITRGELDELDLHFFTQFSFIETAFWPDSFFQPLPSIVLFFFPGPFFCCRPASDFVLLEVASCYWMLLVAFRFWHQQYGHGPKNWAIFCAALGAKMTWSHYLQVNSRTTASVWRLFLLPSDEMMPSCWQKRWWMQKGQASEESLGKEMVATAGRRVSDVKPGLGALKECDSAILLITPIVTS